MGLVTLPGLAIVSVAGGTTGVGSHMSSGPVVLISGGTSLSVPATVGAAVVSLAHLHVKSGLVHFSCGGVVAHPWDVPGEGSAVGGSNAP